MDARRLVKPFLFISLALALVGGAGVVLARGPAVPAMAPPPPELLGSAFTYQGRLMDGGSAAKGLYDLQFELFDSTDVAVGPLVELDNVSVADGFFTVQLDFGDVFDGRRLWLQVGVRPGGSTDPYTILAERQDLTAAPYALYARDVYARTVIASPVGTPEQNGDALLAALESITDASSSSPWVLKIEPGRYDLGSQSLSMKEWVDIEGSGELITTITASGSSSSDTGTVVGADNAELRFVTVENTGGSTYAIAIYSGETSPRLTQLTASASGGSNLNIGVYNYAETSASPTMENVTAIASGGTSARGVDNAGSSPTMKRVTATGQDATDTNYGIYDDGEWITMADVTATASGGNSARAIRNNHCSMIMTNITARAFGGASENWAVWNQNSPALMSNVTATALGTNSVGMLCTGSLSNVAVDHSRINGTTNTIDAFSAGTTLVGACRLAGGPVTGTGVTCAGVYDEAYTFYANTCP